MRIPASAELDSGLGVILWPEKHKSNLVAESLSNLQIREDFILTEIGIVYADFQIRTVEYTIRELVVNTIHEVTHT
jgi:hypothetical protein